ncbi:hypothetical protein [Parashewanella tropica]|uniref:hypothetical protein n=1 Tax=Parashewanella tropica TaxID=2547970 RepID=UPI00105992D8|nr:hypothetical protein [Parashewanella tropica]
MSYKIKLLLLIGLISNTALAGQSDYFKYPTGGDIFLYQDSAVLIPCQPRDDSSNISSITAVINGKNILLDDRVVNDGLPNGFLYRPPYGVVVQGYYGKNFSFSCIITAYDTIKDKDVKHQSKTTNITIGNW